VRMSPKPRRKWLKILWYLWLTLIGIPVVYLFRALVLGLVPVNAGFVQPEKGIDIYVSTNGAHADLVVPTRTEHMDWFELFPPEHFRRVDTTFEYVAFGWGDRGFYLETPTWDDLTFSVAMRSLFWPTPAAMHVDLTRRIPSDDENYVRIRISEEQYVELLDHLLGDFMLDDDGQLMLIEDGSYYDSDNFYEAHGRYHFIKTSNTWTAQGLRKIGVRTAVWSPFDRAIMYHARRVK
jgi:uncharacterized protein (TIGR02117 family)